MVWLKYYKANGHVEDITVDEPVIDETKYGKYKTDSFKIGDEITYYIVVTPEGDGFFTSSIRQSASAQDIERRLKEYKQGLKDEITLLKSEVATVKAGLEIIKTPK